MFYTLLLVIFYGLIFSTSGQCENGGEQVLILRLKDVNVSLFNTDIGNTGLENEDEPEANTYSIIGNLNRDEFKNDDDSYEFYLVYGGTSNYDQDIKLRWKQSIWLTETFNANGTLLYAPGFVEIDFDPADTSSGNDRFYGLGLSDFSNSHCYLDGTGKGADWFNCVGAMAKFGTPGIASYNRGSSQSEALYACTNPCAGVTCDDEGELCIDGVCSKNCPILDIDGFLTDCSQEFESQNIGITAIEGKLTDLELQINDIDADIVTNAGNIGTNGGIISSNAADIDELKTDVSSNDQDISQIKTNLGDLETNLQSQIDDINDEIAQFRAWLGKTPHDSGSAAMFGFDGDLDGEYHNDNMNKPYYSWSWQNIAIIVVILLLILNLIVMTYSNCCRNKRKKKRYQKVRCMDSEDVDSEANLK